jgi:osmotically-inducible protein OsmY
MGNIRLNRRTCLLVALLAGIGGCEGQDADHLEHAAHLLADKFDGWTGGAEKRLATGLQALRTEGDQLSLDARVGARLRWDKLLDGVQIQVQARESAIELKGTVTTVDQRRRAVELAESTAGVDKVTDSLEGPRPEQ